MIRVQKHMRLGGSLLFSRLVDSVFGPPVIRLSSTIYPLFENHYKCLRHSIEFSNLWQRSPFLLSVKSEPSF